MGTLDDGIEFVVIPYFLYWDGFRFYGTKTTSGDEIYAKFIDLSNESNSSHANIHVLARVPPRGSTNSALNALKPEIVKGATEGFEFNISPPMKIVAFLI